MLWCDFSTIFASKTTLIMSTWSQAENLLYRITPLLQNYFPGFMSSCNKLDRHQWEWPCSRPPKWKRALCFDIVKVSAVTPRARTSAKVHVKCVLLCWLDFPRSLTDSSSAPRYTPSNTFGENQLGSFCVILQTDGHQQKHNTLVGGNSRTAVMFQSESHMLFFTWSEHTKSDLVFVFSSV